MMNWLRKLYAENEKSRVEDYLLERKRECLKLARAAMNDQNWDVVKLAEDIELYLYGNDGPR